ncbi:unnamed protein product [Cylicocyclus nassatus]|uniref:Aquaporin-9 n=1 Tax=Cylicocyclus nassatus TaxID=53992 RepID=A0AA36DRX8_CYLNA|nr:unnamed protein product [Cylicocyclus nassatus]
MGEVNIAEGGSKDAVAEGSQGLKDAATPEAAQADKEARGDLKESKDFARQVSRETTTTEAKQEESMMEKLRHRFGIENQLFKEILAEFFCTGLLLFWGDSSVAQLVVSNRMTNEWVALTISWGVALWMSVQMSIRISGAHLNPAVSFFLFTQKKITFRKFVIFSIAQTAGAFCGALGVFVLWYDGINHFDGGKRQVKGMFATAGIFATYPKPYLTIAGGIVDQIFGTAILCLGVATITDKRNGIPPFLQPACIGFLLVGIGTAFAHNCGYAINPARDLGPRLLTLCVGYGWETFSYNEYGYFWIPIICPMIGAALGAWLYEFVIGFHLPEAQTYQVCKVEERESGGADRTFKKADQSPSHTSNSDIRQDSKETDKLIRKL